MDGYLGCLGYFHLLTIVNSVVMNICVQVLFFLTSVFTYFGYISRSIISRSCGNFVFIFLRNGQTFHFMFPRAHIHTSTCFVFYYCHSSRSIIGSG